MCNRCLLADPDRPFRYAASVAGRMAAPPPWWDLLTEFTAARYHPGGTVSVLRETSRMLIKDPTVTPHQFRRSCGASISATTERVLTEFFVSQGLTLAPPAPSQERAELTRRRYLDAIPPTLRPAVTQYNDAQIADQERRSRTGRRTLSNITLATRLRILRDLARHLVATREITGWAEITTADLECFLATNPDARHQRTYVLRRFFAWSKARRLILVDPARSLALGAQPGFTGTVLDLTTQRVLFRRWTSQATPPEERLIGLLALLHAASNAEIRTLTVASIDLAHQTVTLGRRPAPTPIDPASWAAIEACLHAREATGTVNPYLLVSRFSSTRDIPVHTSHVSRLLAAAGTTPAQCRQTRLSQLVTDLDPKLTATVLGMKDSGLVRYLADNVDRDRLHHTAPSKG